MTALFVRNLQMQQLPTRRNQIAIYIYYLHYVSQRLGLSTGVELEKWFDG
jgi:hypothetical protein